MSDATSTRQLYDSFPVLARSRCIRLLDLDAVVDPDGASPSSALKGTLRVVNLDAGRPFVALSYVWGTKEAYSRHKIICQPAHELDLTANCYEALWHIRKIFGRTTIWVDSICINQDDDDEKISQLQLMEDIYSQAEAVYIWLGPGDDASDRAMGFLQKRASVGRRMPLAFLTARARSHAIEKKELSRFRWRVWKDILDRISLFNPAGRGIHWERLLDREWSHRAWTFQELVLANHPIIICGDKVLSWEDLVSAAYSGGTTRGFTRKPVRLSSDTLSNWRCMIDLWLDLPRRQRSNPNNAENIKPPISFNEGLTAIWGSKGDVPLPLKCFSVVSTTLLVLSIYWPGFYFIWKYVEVFQAGVLEAIGYTFLWVVSITTPAVWFAMKWLTLLQGETQQHWVRTAGSAAVLDGIRAALRERISSRPHDKAFALFGILTAYGMSPETPSYSRSVGDTYRLFFQDLLKWQPTALILLLDAGGPSQPDRPSWIPSWDVAAKPNQWLSDRYRLTEPPEGAVIENATPLTNPPLWKLLQDQLWVRGQREGVVCFITRCDQGPCPSAHSNDAVRSALLHLHTWFRAVSWRVPQTGAYDNSCSFLFAILEGLAPRRHPTTRWEPTYGGYAGSSGTVRTFPDWQAPYDYSTKKKDFKDFKKLYQVMAEFTTGCNPDRMIAAVNENIPAHKYATKVLKKILAEERCLFILSNGRAGTGPMEMQQGDEVFLIAGVPSPMMLRRSREESHYGVVGPTLVHGLMNGEAFEEYNLDWLALV